MRVPRLFSGVIWALVATLTGWAIAARPAAISHSELIYEPTLAYALPPGTSGVFLVGPDVQRAKLISRSALPRNQAHRIGDPYDYAVHVEWLDDEHHPVMDHTFWESAGVSRMPGPGLSSWQNAWLRDSSETLTDDRITSIPVKTVLPAGGYLRLAAPATGAPLYVRLYGEQVRGRVDSSLALFGPTTELQDGLLRRIGLPAWSLLDRGERRALARTMWRTLAPDAATRKAIEPRWVMHSDLRLSEIQQRLAWQVLDAKRSVALDLVGPTDVRLSGQPEIADLHVSWVSAGEAPLTEHAGPPVHFGGASRARVFHVPHGPGSLVFRNPTDRPIGPFWWTLDEIGPETLYGKTEAARISDMPPPGIWTGEDAILVGPEWNLLDAARASDGRDLSWSGAWPTGGDVLQLLVRAVLSGPDDDRPRTLRVTAWDALGRKVWSDAASVVVQPAPFEHLLGSEHWIGEPVRTWIPVDARVHRITVSTRDDLLLTMHAHGAPQGDATFYPPLDDDLRVRYGRRPLTDWRTLDPDGTLSQEQRARIAANTRLVPRRTAQDAAVHRYYTHLEPEDAPRPDRVWLVPPADPHDLRSRTLYCRYGPGRAAFDRTPEAARRLDGVLSGTLWTSGALALGAPYRIALDGQTWQEGRLAQRVYRFRTGREPAHRRLDYEGPPGSTLWLRTWAAPGPDCPDPHEGRRYWEIDPGERLVYDVHRTMPQQVFAVSALGKLPATLWVHIDDGQTVTAGLYPNWTKRQRELPIEAGEDAAVAWPLDDPDTSAPVLASRGMLLASNLVGQRYRVTLQNLSGSPIFIRGLLQTPAPGQADYGVEEIGLIQVDSEGGP